MGVIENIDRIEQGKTSIISSIKSKGVNVPNNILINEIAPYIENIEGGGDAPVPQLDYDYICIENLEDTDGTITFNKFLLNVEVSEDEFKTINETFNGRFTYPIKANSKVWIKWNELSFGGGEGQNIVVDKQHNISGLLKNGNISYAYFCMFYNNTNLIDASELKLPATKLATYCYHYMFSGCSSLVEAPSLPATTLANYCYYGMFQSCKNLTTAPELSATTLATYCYSFMFEGCTALTTAPNLPATELTPYCYSSMFAGCTALTTAPELPATTLASECYRQIFYNCISLTQAPALPATKLQSYCYQSMFYNCKKINYVKHNITEWNTSYTNGWLNNVASSGTVECPNGSTIPNNNTSGIPSGWSKKEIPINYDEALILTNLTDSQNTFTVDLPTSWTYYYKINNDEWASISGKNSFTVESGSKLYLINTYRTTVTYSTMITATANFKISGTLPNGNISYAYFCMFYNNTNLIDASELKLPATKLATYCYHYMFNGCSSLVEAPSLPATTIASSCYSYMFYGCTALTTAPQLPATKLASECYYNMFNGCSSLVEAPSLPATTIASSCYYNMFNGCSKLNYVKTNVVSWNTSYTNNWLNRVASSGTVETPSTNIPTNSTNGIPSGWSKKLINYDEMFPEEEPTEPSLPEVAENEDILVIENVDEVEGTVFMYNLNNIPIQYSTNASEFNDYTTASEISIKPNEKVYFKWSDVINNSSNSTALVNSTVKYKVYGELKKGNTSNAYRYMFRKESNLIDASQLKLTATQLADYCYYYMFNGCTALTQAPELPATTLASHCYYKMFDSCSSLTTAPALPATTLASNCYYRMFYNSNLTTAPELPATVLAESCYSYMFAFCFKLTYVKHHITEWNTSNTISWINGAATGTVECPIDSTIPSDNDNGIPKGWTRVDF